MNQSSGGDRLPLFSVRIPDFEKLNTGLLKTIGNMTEIMPGNQTNQADGRSYFENKWLSSSDLHQNTNADIQHLVSFIEQTANRVFRKPEADLIISIFSMWGMVSKSGMTGIRHNHSGRVSGAYYVDAGTSGIQDGGSIQFFQKPELTQASHRITPESGQLLLFPSFLEHAVSRYKGENPRTVIAFNLR